MRCVLFNSPARGADGPGERHGGEVAAERLAALDGRGVVGLASPDRLESSCYDRGRLVERADGSLSADGATPTDTLWRAGHADEKDVNVLVRR